MPITKTKQINTGTIIILDIGKNVSEPQEKNENSFFEAGTRCTARIIERKIMSQGKTVSDFVGIILLGSKQTCNNLAEQGGGFRHIEMMAELKPPTWQMIRDLPETASKSKGDWVDALLVAADHFTTLHNGVSGVKIENKKIILITNFLMPTTYSSEIQEVINGFTMENFEVDILGPDIYEENLKNRDLELAKQFVEETNGNTASFDCVMQYLNFHKRKSVRPTPWNVNLSIGNIKIPVSSYIRIKDEPVVGKWLKAVKDPVTGAASTTESVAKSKVFKNIENQTNVEQSDVIKGYHYGQEIISGIDNSMLYESGEKCLTVYGFTSVSNITWQCLTGDGLSYVFGRKGDKKAQYAIGCLVECLHEMKLAAIARRVYNKNNCPKMFALMPVIDSNDYMCLSMVCLCYKEDIKHIVFPPVNLKKYECTDEQVNAFKDLIDAMDLTKAFDETYEDTEAFPIAETVSPAAQYVLDCFVFRALNPGKPLPEPKDEIMALFKVPPTIEKRAREPLDKIKNLFHLTKIEAKKRTRKPKFDDNWLNVQPDAINVNATDSVKIELPTIKSDVDSIGTIDPVDDFKLLIEKGKTLTELSSEMIEAIEILIYWNLDGNYSKAFNAIKYFRSECMKYEPGLYNNWLKRFKSDLNDRKRNDILELFVDNNVNFILKSENSLSSYDEDNIEEDSQLYENDTQPNLTELTIDSEVNDMFDNM